MPNRQNLRRAAARRAARTTTGPDPTERIAALTGMARGSWIALLSYLAFISVTLLGVKDADFFLIERDTDLPLIGVSIPTSLFFYIAPALGAMLYIQLHLYLVRLWRALDSLPNRSDMPVADMIRPWIVSDMALSRKPGAVHAYPLRSLSNTVVFLFTFAAGPVVLAAFWWRSMPKHDEVLTILACGIPLFAVVYAGAESWRGLRAGAATQRHVTGRERAGWGAGLLALSAIGFLTTEGGVTNALLRPANLQDVVFVETPPDWLPRDEAEQVFRREWCAQKGIPKTACGPGPLARDAAGDRIRVAEDDRVPRTRWCRETWGKDRQACFAFFATLAEEYAAAWAQARENALAALPARDLSGVDLRGANLRGARIDGADLRLARLEGAELYKARMEEANLWQARMEEADLSGARLEGADLWQARMAGANLSNARMEGANLLWARMEGANLTGAWMGGANLREARLEGAILSMARMEGAVLNGARMEGATLREARLEGADLWQARMQAAVLTSAQVNEETHLRYTSIRSAALATVNLSMLDLTQEQIDSAFGDASVTLPDGLVRPAHWPTWTIPKFGDNTFDDEWRRWQANPSGYTPPPPPGD